MDWQEHRNTRKILWNQAGRFVFHHRWVSVWTTHWACQQRRLVYPIYPNRGCWGKIKRHQINRLCFTALITVRMCLPNPIKLHWVHVWNYNWRRNYALQCNSLRLRTCPVGMRSRAREVKSIVLITDFELELIADGGDARGRKQMRITATLPLCTRYQKQKDFDQFKRNQSQKVSVQ